MPRARSTLKYALGVLVVGCVGFFFWRTLRESWASIQAHEFHVAWPLLFLSFVAAGATVLLYDYAWYVSTNSLLSGTRVTFSQTCAVVNTSSLTKYVPGKIWSFAYQMYWLSKLGLPKSLVVYVNLLNTLVSIVASVLLGLALLLVSSDHYPWQATLGLLTALVVADVVFLAFHTPLLNTGIAVLNRVLRKSIPCFDISLGMMLRLHAVHLLAAVVSALGGYAICFGLGYRIEFDKVLLLMSSMLLAEVIGFFAFMVPGGLGVREGAMYLILGGASLGSLAIVLPLATRLVAMAAELVLGVIAVRLMPRVVAKETA